MNGRGSHQSSPARNNNRGWRERQDRVKAIELPVALQFETWDREGLPAKMFEEDLRRSAGGRVPQRNGHPHKNNVA